MSLSVGSNLGPYEVLGLLGAGGTSRAGAAHCVVDFRTEHDQPDAGAVYKQLPSLPGIVRIRWVCLRGVLHDVHLFTGGRFSRTRGRNRQRNGRDWRGNRNHDLDLPDWSRHGCHFVRPSDRRSGSDSVHSDGHFRDHGADI
jgi:hypothetical protein